MAVGQNKRRSDGTTKSLQPRSTLEPATKSRKTANYNNNSKDRRPLGVKPWRLAKPLLGRVFSIQTRETTKDLFYSESIALGPRAVSYYVCVLFRSHIKA